LQLKHDTGKMYNFEFLWEYFGDPIL
jgi:hypothetical protein